MVRANPGLGGVRPEQLGGCVRIYDRRRALGKRKKLTMENAAGEEPIRALVHFPNKSAKMCRSPGLWVCHMTPVGVML